MPMMIIMLIIIVAGFFFVYQGGAMHNAVPREEAKFHAQIDSYYILSKAERDGAPSGSELNKQLVELQKYPSSLLELKLVGVGKILTGIVFVLFAILMALMVAMPKRLAAIIKKENGG